MFGGAVAAPAGITFVTLSNAEMDALVASISGSFADTTPFALAGFTPTDAFFPAKGQFNIFSTCNAWVGQMFRAARLPFGRWTPFPQSIRLALDAANLTADTFHR